MSAKINLINSFSNETKLFETFSTYKIFTLELISTFCLLRRSKDVDIEKKSNEQLETSIENSSICTKDTQLSSTQELKIINLILRSIKSTDSNANTLIQTVVDDSELRTFLNFFNDQIENLGRSPMIKLKSLMNDLKICFIPTTNANDPWIRPWSIVGKYVRRCIIIYEKMQFDKIVDLSKKASIQFKNLHTFIVTRMRIQRASNTSINNNSSVMSFSKKMNEIDTSNSPLGTACTNNPSAVGGTGGSAAAAGTSSAAMGLFMNDESNLTITSEWLNRSANADDCSGMDLEQFDESINQQQNRFNQHEPLNQKALTSTVSAQRTQSISNLKSSISTKLHDAAADNNAPPMPSSAVKPTVTFQLPSKNFSMADESSVIRQLNPNDSNLMPPPVSESLLGHHDSQFITNSCAFSRKIAEYFVSKQAYLLENNEHDALNPIELEDKINELIAYDPTFADAYYLRYLNYLRLNDYPSSLKALHDYFDRYLLAGTVSVAALNLCSLEFRFANKENAYFALKEAITSAHQEGDVACLQHSLSWLYKIEPFYKRSSIARKRFLIKSACSRSINSELYSLASYNLHYFSRYSIGKNKPKSILNLLNKTDIINLKIHNKTEVNLLSQCHKAAMWDLYGQRKISNLYSQMLLNFLPKSNLNKINSESQCIAMCRVALELSRNGQCSASQIILNRCNEIYASNLKLNYHLLNVDNLILIEKYLLAGKFSLCRAHIERLASVNFQQSLIHEMNVFIVEGNYEKAKQIGFRIMSLLNISDVESCQINNYTNNVSGMNSTQDEIRDNFFKNINNDPQFDFFNDQLNISLNLNYIEIYIGLNEYSNALIAAIKLYNEIRKMDFNYEVMICCLLIAKILIFMEYPEQAIKYIQKCIVYVFSNGCLLDQAKLHYLYAKCLFTLDKKKNLETSISHMYQCIEKLEKIQASIYLVAAYAFMSLLLNENGKNDDRNKFASKYRQLREQLPLINYLL